MRDTGESFYYGVPLQFYENVIDPTYEEVLAAQARYRAALEAQKAPQRITDVMYSRDAKLEDLEAKVNNAVAQGWQPVGPVQIDAFADYVTFVQTLVLYDDPSEAE